MNDTFTESTEYRLCRAVIARLRADEALRHLVFGEPFDRADQGQMLAASAGQYSGVVAVLPQPMSEQHADAKTGVFTLRLAVVVLATQDVVPGMTAQEFASRMMERVLGTLYRWRPGEGSRLAPRPLKVEGMETIYGEQYEGLQNLVGLGVTFTKEELLGQL